VTDLDRLINPLDVPGLRAAFRGAQPFPWVCIDDFLVSGFAREVRDAFPSLVAARQVGRRFRAVNERGKVEVNAHEHLPPPVRALHDLLASPPWLACLSDVTGIPSLVADPDLEGGGLHIYEPGAHLDVHVDFNLVPEQRLFRRLNILVFFNEGWRPEWGGELELWDARVATRRQAFLPIFNRCVVFETSEKSFHGVPQVSSPPGTLRLSCAAYYYTHEPPPAWDGRYHSTVFRPRPDERWKGRVLMPLETLARSIWRTVRYGSADPERLHTRSRR